MQVKSEAVVSKKKCHKLKRFELAPAVVYGAIFWEVDSCLLWRRFDGVLGYLAA